MLPQVLIMSCMQVATLSAETVSCGPDYMTLIGSTKCTAVMHASATSLSACDCHIVPHWKHELECTLFA